MCEWLSNGEWCDVQLLCGGRSFSAHRAVLASVSNFLRKVLLSCPVDESPVFIVLPDFDHDTMSSILYYIYNGEVVIPNHKLRIFLDTAKAMEIFIDQQYVPKTYKYLRYSKPCTNNSEFVVNKYNFCQLEPSKEQNACYVNIRKGMRIEDLLRQLQKSLGNLNFRDDTLRYRRWSNEHVPDLENLKSLSGFRQRQSFLRDIFIETCSQNGNSNGLTAGVLAISNEHYRAPTSVLLTNANGKHPSANDTLLDTSESTLQRQTTSIFDSFKQLHYIPKCKENINEPDSSTMSDTVVDNKLETSNFNCECTLQECSKTVEKINSWKSHISLGITSQLFPIDSLSNISSDRQCASLNLSHTKATSDLKSLSGVSKGCESSVVKNSCNTFDQDIFQDACIIEESKGTHTQSCRTIAKGTILNEVLQSPWRPSQPNNYKPLRSKLRISLQSQKIYENTVDLGDSNDKNNNRDSQFQSKINVNADNEISPDQRENQCAICHQVFTSSDAYDVHMRRHLSGSRYSCEECHKTFSQLRNFKYHMSVHRGTKEFATTCPICGKYFNDRGYLSSHMKIHRNRKEYKCASCPKSFNQRVAYNMHVRIHTGVKPHVCGECGKAFSRKMLLKQHQRTHSGERPYACAHCDKRFADRSNMTLHLRLHTGVKPFSCTLCPKSFTKKHHLKSHLNFHTGAKPYSCPRCKLAFTQSSNMRTHYKKCIVTAIDPPADS
ncbi:uncharacterized protein [Epargyreus clarus]|uniref:uncharacterized protein n=1 Tax=Epargyreus clarus TaxID=520877 RepID=UPI003C2F11BE